MATLLQSMELPGVDLAYLEDWCMELVRARQIDFARRLGETWSRRSPNSPLSFFHLGAIAIFEEKWNLALYYHQIALRCDPQPELADRCNELISILFERGDYQYARAYCQALLAIVPKACKMRYNLGTIHNKLGEERVALTQHLEAIYQDPTLVDGETLEKQVSLFLQLETDSHERLETLFTRLLDRRPEAISLHLKWGDRLAQSGRREEAARVGRFCVRQLAAIVRDERDFARYYTAWSQHCNTADVPLVPRLELLRALLQINAADPVSTASATSQLARLRQLHDRAEHNPTIDLERIVDGWGGWNNRVPPPVGVIAQTQRYCQSTGLIYTQIHPATTFSLPPLAIENGEPSILASTNEGDTPATFVTTIPRGHACWGGNTNIPSLRVGAILSPEDQLLADVSPAFPLPMFNTPPTDMGRHWTFFHTSLPPIVHLPGRVAVLATLTGEGEVGNYFHWLTDLLPRVELLKRAGIDLQSIDTYLVDSYGGQFQKDSLEALGVPGDRVVDVRQHWHVQADELVLPSLAGKLTNPSQWVCRWLRETYTQLYAPESLSSTSHRPRRRLYISRGHSHHRTILNKPEVIARLEALGFVCVEPHKLSFADQVRLFAEAEAVVALHGAGLTNTVFCPPGAKVIELFSPGYVLPYYWVLCDRAGHQYFCLAGDGVRDRQLKQILYPNLMTEDAMIDPQKLDRILQRAGLTARSE